MNNHKEMPANVVQAVAFLKPFMNVSQMKVMWDNCFRSEGEWFQKKFVSLAEQIRAMPVTYEQSQLEGKAVVHLHYFLGGTDFYITEKDVEGNGTIQAFGCYFDMGTLAFEYISIMELVENGFELDLHWKPIPADELKD